MGKPSQVDAIIAEVAGDDVVDLVKKLKNKKNVSEFTLADSLKQEINITRNMLYRLYNANLVSFTRKKDKKKGWYIYYWTFNTKRVEYLTKVLRISKLEKLKERLEREESEQFFICPNQCIRLDFEQAMNFEFKCPECGLLIQMEDNAPKIVALKKEIGEIEKALAVQIPKIKKQKASPRKTAPKPQKKKQSVKAPAKQKKKTTKKKK